MSRFLQLIAVGLWLAAGVCWAQDAAPRLQDLDGKRIAVLTGSAGDLAAQVIGSTVKVQRLHRAVLSMKLNTWALRWCVGITFHAVAASWR